MSPLVSIVMSVYNAEDFICEALESCLNQTYSNIEIIIIDDASTDRSMEKISGYVKQFNINLIRNNENLGLVKSLNKGIDASSGKYLARMDADDICIPTRIEKQVAAFESNEKLVLLGSNYEIFDGKDRVMNLPLNNEACKFALETNNPFCHPSVMIRMKVLIENNLYYPNDKHIEDFSFFTQLSKYGEISNIKDILMRYRYHQGQITNKYNGFQVESKISYISARDDVDISKLASSLYSRLKYINRPYKRFYLKGFLELLPYLEASPSFRLKVFFNSLLYANYRNLCSYVITEFKCRNNDV